MSSQGDSGLERTMMPGFYKVNRGGSEEYISGTRVLQEPSLAAEVLDQALLELREWFGRYYALYSKRPELRPVLAPVIRAIEEVVT